MRVNFIATLVEKNFVFGLKIQFGCGIVCAIVCTLISRE